jgi:hypothetical protein
MNGFLLCRYEPARQRTQNAPYRGKPPHHHYVQRTQRSHVERARLDSCMPAALPECTLHPQVHRPRRPGPGQPQGLWRAAVLPRCALDAVAWAQQPPGWRCSQRLLLRAGCGTCLAQRCGGLAAPVLPASAAGRPLAVCGAAALAVLVHLACADVSAGGARDQHRVKPLGANAPQHSPLHALDPTAAPTATHDIQPCARVAAAGPPAPKRQPLMSSNKLANW